ncbi:hypothetical protein P3S68_018123 [Capsicum galapagoense]
MPSLLSDNYFAINSICFNGLLNYCCIAFCYTIWNGSWCYSTRVSNELRSGNPQKAQVAVKVAMFLAVASTVTFLHRGVLGKAYSNNQQGVDYVSAITPFLCLSIITDSSGKWMSKHWSICE